MSLKIAATLMLGKTARLMLNPQHVRIVKMSCRFVP
jgi:hypothetical protein